MQIVNHAQEVRMCTACWVGQCAALSDWHRTHSKRPVANPMHAPFLHGQSTAQAQDKDIEVCIKQVAIHKEANNQWE